MELLRQMLDETPEVIRGSQTLPAWCETGEEVDARLTKEAQSALRPVINLTVLVLHTNLGRVSFHRRKPRWKPLRRLCVRQ
ncbi:hypothetical protein ACLB1M_28180 [Escherichia coli]